MTRPGLSNSPPAARRQLIINAEVPETRPRPMDREIREPRWTRAETPEHRGNQQSQIRNLPWEGPGSTGRV